MDIKWLEDFLNLTQTRNFSRSAEERNVTQPAFSRRIRALEAWVGTDLIDRSSYPLMLTPAGKLFRESTEEALRLIYDMRSLLQGQEKNESMLSLAAGHTLSLNFFPGWLQRLQDVHGDIPVRIIATNVYESVLALTEGNCDLLLCYHHADLPIVLDPQRNHFLTLGHDTIVPVTTPTRTGQPKYALPGTKATPLPVLSYNGTSFLGRVIRFITSHAPETSYLADRYQSDMVELLKKMALQGHGIAWLPESSVTAELEDGRLVRAGNHQWALKLDIRLYRSADSKKPMLNKIWDTLSAGR